MFGYWHTYSAFRCLDIGTLILHSYVWILAHLLCIQMFWYWYTPCAFRCLDIDTLIVHSDVWIFAHSLCIQMFRYWHTPCAFRCFDIGTLLVHLDVWILAHLLCIQMYGYWHTYCAFRCLDIGTHCAFRCLDIGTLIVHSDVWILAHTLCIQMFGYWHTYCALRCLDIGTLIAHSDVWTLTQLSTGGGGSFVCVLKKVDIAGLHQFHLFRPESGHSGSASWDNCGSVSCDELCVSTFSLIGSHGMPRQHSHPSLNSLSHARVYACLGVTCNLFWQRDQGLLCATAVIQGGTDTE